MSRSHYVRHLLLSMGTRLAMIALRLMRNVLLARILGPSERGLFALLSTLPDLISAATSGGLNTAVGYQAAKQRSMGLLLSQVLIYGCLVAGALTLVCVALAREFGTELEVTTQLGLLAWLLLLAVPLTVLKSGLLTLHNATGGVGAFNALRLTESLVPLLLFVGLFWMWQHAALEAALISWLLGLSLVVMLGLYWLGRQHSIRLCWDRSGQRELLSYSAKSHPDLLFQQVILRSDYLFISAMLGSAALGHYAMASAAAELLLIVPEAVTTPLMKRLLQQDAGMDKLTPLALRLTATVMLGACLSMALIGEWLIVTLFGAEYQPAYPALLALLPGLFGLCYASILRLDLLGKNRPGTVSLMMGLGAALNLLLNVLLIPTYGIVGAAAASSIAYLAVTLAMLLLYCKLSGVPFWQTLLVLPSDLAPLRQMLQRRPA
ncbi:oligosaccharide flippase family protein [Pseudomonas sp. NPDC087612]|uniref:oligosaccharide flippase family protein n=1 Tax=unclassified Pseudomonas TaxID=196821 RepID=UPI0005EB2DDC|nr:MULTISPECIES: oligosaccharide flippase family protein [unclassified Pseudomonas]KJK16706.1 polysaccharide biosynthesis protein [Pseudomonas sp. 2(2015)]QVM94442.1 oligosaccharide flippase family protein [Pseudomonas sp. SORT22]UVL58700.1 oligosaccharide flippase family protein [Pseudomonas sp. B21-035]UVL64024.1 oligosaccharide flippase family protein [Pseudomonas sp. B21-032]SDQ73412.1 Membrane protein involved in the export of O-antigen and teichoic acid [Pseudomonas sp. UC 17F4]